MSKELGSLNGDTLTLTPGEHYWSGANRIRVTLTCIINGCYDWLYIDSPVFIDEEKSQPYFGSGFHIRDGENEGGFYLPGQYRFKTLFSPWVTQNYSDEEYSFKCCFNGSAPENLTVETGKISDDILVTVPQGLNKESIYDLTGYLTKKNDVSTVITSNKFLLYAA